MMVKSNIVELQWQHVEIFKLRRETEMLREELEEVRFDLKQLEQTVRLSQ